MRLIITFQPDKDINFPAISSAVRRWMTEQGSEALILTEDLLFTAAGWKIILAHDDLLSAVQALHRALDRLGISFEVKVL